MTDHDDARAQARHDFQQLLAAAVQPLRPLPDNVARQVERLLASESPLPPLQRTREILTMLGLPTDDITQLAALCKQALGSGRSINGRSTPESKVLTRKEAARPENGMPVRLRQHGVSPRYVPPDAPGHDGKPDPLDPATPLASFTDLGESLKAYWRWSGMPSSRRLAAASDGAFSHVTVNKLIGNGGEAGAVSFSRSLSYVVAFVHACGGSSDDVCRFATAWRRVEALTRQKEQADNDKV